MLQASDLLPVSDVQALQQAGRILEAASAVTRASGRKLDQLAESDDWLNARFRQLAGIPAEVAIFEALDAACEDVTTIATQLPTRAKRMKGAC
ncbi:MAG: hypothetical protein AAF418_06680, partial [Pseudomonadota bacterium]